MAKNDEFLLDGIIESYVFDENISLDIGEKFEFLCLEQILKSYDLNAEEIKSGHTDGRIDGGIDGAYIFVNGAFYSEKKKTSLPKSDGVVDVIIINCKHENAFRENTINTLIASSQEIFDFSVADIDISSRYNSHVMNFRRSIMSLYREMAIYSPKMRFSFYISTRGDVNKVGETIIERSKQLEFSVSEYFRDSEVSSIFLGAAEILTRYRKIRPMTLEVPIVRDLSEDGKCFIVLCKIKEFYKFLCDSDGNLRRYQMDANIRDYLGSNKVNLDIKASLDDDFGPEFWWLNNGVTIIASSANVVAGRLIARDIQIINGLQTSQTIFQHFKAGRKTSENKSIMIKIIASEEKALSDKIIVASNNQSTVEQAALRGTDKLQRDIEDALEAKGWFYERRVNFHKNMGRPEEKIVSPMYAAGAYVAICMKSPLASSRLKSRFMRSDINYRRVFNEEFSVSIWPIIIEIQKASDEKLSYARKLNNIGGEKLLKNWRGVLSLLTVGKIFGTIDFPPNDLKRIAVDDRYRAELDEIWFMLEPHVRGTAGPGKNFLQKILQDYSALFNVKKVDAIDKQILNLNSIHKRPNAREVEIDDEFVASVDSLLPVQPWLPGVHRRVANELGCSSKKAQAAIQKLIEQGKRFNQRDGVILKS